MTPIVITTPEFAKGEAAFTATPGIRWIPCAPDEAAVTAAVLANQARAVVLGVAPYRGPLYPALAGGTIVRFGVGMDNLDHQQARAHGIAVRNTPGVLEAAVAELTVGLMLGLARHLPVGRTWPAGRPAAGGELAGRSLGLIGFGGIARRVGRIAGAGLGMAVHAAGRVPLAEAAAREGLDGAAFLARHGLAAYLTADEALERCEVIALHLPGTAAGFLDAARLARCRPGALLINTARGSLIDEDALYEALVAGRISGAALDVTRQEPYVPQSPGRDLGSLPNVILSPHIGSNTCEANVRMAQAVISILLSIQPA